MKETCMLNMGMKIDEEFGSRDFLELRLSEKIYILLEQAINESELEP
jgi:hypothetical protein